MAKAKTEIIAQIRFGIHQLSARNGQMDFEHICRFYARSRIHLNILPATGPVQSGGDQGRDFETFHSYMAQCSIAPTSFVGLFSEQPIVFACSLEQDPAKKNGKIETDIATILKAGVPVERIYFFSGQDIPVAKRHKVQERIRNSKGIEIELIDAGALAEHLSDPDLFWVANRYLDVSGEYYVLPTGPAWYNELKTEYQLRDDQDRTPTFEEFSEIKSALRRIYKDNTLKVDLPFWFTKLALYLSDEVYRPLKRKAIYEQFVAKLIGQNDIEGQEELVRDYFLDFANFRTPAVLEDATILLSFIISSKRVVGHSINENEITPWKQELWPILEEEWQGASDAGKKVWLAVIKAHYQFQVVSQPSLLEAISSLLGGLQEAIPYFEDAYFYPFDDLSKTVNHFIELLLDHNINSPVVEELESFARRVDDEIGKRYGEQEAGERLKLRAVHYFEKERYLQALDAFHRLKHKWTSADSPKGIVLTGLFIAQCYERLRMDFASRYYALAVAQVVAKSDDADLQKYLPKALLIAAEACYASGAWLSYVDTLDLCIMTHMISTKDFELYDESRQNVGIVFQPTVIAYIAQRYNLESQHLFSYRFGRWGFIGEEISASLPIAKAHYDRQTDNELDNSLQNQLNNRIFSDLGPERTIAFEIYGSRWSVVFINDFETNAAAEQLAAIIQILMVELADVEMYLIQSKIEINFGLKAGISTPTVQINSSNEETRWQVYFPMMPTSDEDYLRESQVFYSALVVSILQDISLMPVDQLVNAVHTRFKEQELVGRLLFVATYQSLYRNFVSKKEFVESARQHFTDSQRFSQFEPRSNSKLPWEDTLAPLYNLEASNQAIQNRLSFMHPYEITLPKLKTSSRFLAIVQKLRDKNWLDWQIAVSVGNLIVNYKIQQVSPFYDPAVARAKAFEFYSRPETEWYIPIPETLLNVEHLEEYLNTLQTMSVLQSFGLESHSGTPNINAIFELLSKRFNYMTDGADIKVFD